jgi:hypothetical protein
MRGQFLQQMYQANPKTSATTARKVRFQSLKV